MNPLYRRRAITLTFDQFEYGWTNALDEDEARRLYDAYHVTGSGIALAQMGSANLNPWPEAKVDTRNPDRGPLLIPQARTAVERRSRKASRYDEAVRRWRRSTSPTARRWPR